MTEKELGVGDEAPGFCLPDQDGEEACLDDFGAGESSSTSTRGTGRGDAPWRPWPSQLLGKN